MFNKFRQGIRTRILNGINNVISDVGPLSFFSQWFNPNNLVGELEQLEKYTGYVYTCVSAIAEDVAKIKITLGQTQLDGTIKPVQNHNFLKLLKQPNPTQSDYEFWEMVQTHIELAGEAFLYVAKGEITGAPKELWIMRPDLVQIVYDQETGEVTGYVYHKYNGRIQVPLDLTEVIQFKMPNPINPYRGMGTVQAGIVYIQTEEYASRYSRNYLANNATPAGIVNLKGTIKQDEFDKIKRQWSREYGNVANAGKTAILRDVDAEYIKVGSTLADIDLAALKNLTRDDIMTMFRVSKPILGITEDVNYANAKTAEYVFAKRVIDPKMNRIVDTLQTYYSANYRDGYVLGYTSPIPQDNDEKIAYYTAAVNTWLTPNEVRRAEGFEDTPGGNDIRMPFNLQPISDEEVPTNNNQQQDEQSAGGTKTIKLKIRSQKTLPAGKVKLKMKPKPLTRDQKEKFREQLLMTAKAFTPQIEDKIKGVLADQKNHVIRQLHKNKKRDLSDNIDYNSDGTTDDLVTALMPIFTELMQHAGKYGLLVAGAEELQYELSQKSIERITARVKHVAANFNQQTQDALVSAIKDGLTNGDTIAQLSSSVEDVFGQAMGYRAERLARTEAVHEANYSTLDAYEQTGYVIKKEWYAGGPDPCEFCAAMNGTTIDTEEVFVSKGDSVTGTDGGLFHADYEDVEAGDLHPNCECTIMPVIEQ